MNRASASLPPAVNGMEAATTHPPRPSAQSPRLPVAAASSEFTGTAPAAPGKTWLDTRAAGVLAHISALPGEFGIGNLGSGARRFINLIGASGMRYWQICPIGPTGYGDSPYQLFSGRAGNPYFIDLGELEAAELLTPTDLTSLRALSSGRVDYGGLYRLFWPILARAHDRFAAEGRTNLAGCGSLREFRIKHVDWLDPFAHFMALKTNHGGRPWTDWPVQLRTWSASLRDTLPDVVRRDAERHIFYQYVFFSQWERLRRYASERCVGIIGDVPFFVALDSADAWQSRANFLLDAHGQPRAVAGVPPDYFSDVGQYWGNPLYDWEYLARTGYTWWIDRLAAAFALYDIIRLDHFRGFESYWEIPATAADARTGSWRPGPGRVFFEALRVALPQARIIAEDLGYIGRDVVELRRDAGLPGMKVLQFAYGHDANNVNLPHFHPVDSVVYPGTHDNDTTRGWLESLTPEAYAEVDAYFQLAGGCSAWPLIRAAMASPARLAVIPLQDLLDLPSSARLNRPGTPDGNWAWRCSPAAFAELAGEPVAQFRRLCSLYDRDGDPRQRDYSAPPGILSQAVNSVLTSSTANSSRSAAP